jgi:hypothetical protein
MTTNIPGHQVTRLFTFGYGQMCPYTGKDLGDHYVLVAAPDASSARTFMNTAFKRNWAFEYDGPTDRMISGYLPRMTLHMEVNFVHPDPTGLAYTRADDEAVDPTPPGPRESLHTGGMTEGGLVDETETKCSPECDELALPGTVSGRERGWHDDDCPVAREVEDERDLDSENDPAVH